MEDHLESLVLRMYKGGILYSEAVREFQKVFVLTVLREQQWNQTKAAQTMGVHRNTLRRLIHEFQLDIRSLNSADIAEYAVMLAVILVIVVGSIRLIGANATNVLGLWRA